MGVRWLWPPLAAVVLATLLPLAVFLVATFLAGYHLQSVQSGSMQPTYPVGSLLVVEPIDPSDVRVGMPLMFVSPEDHRTVTHRVVGAIERDDSLSFRTQGDANGRPDPALVTASEVRGRVRWAVPRLATLLTWLQWPRNVLLLVVTPAVVLIAGEVRAWRRRAAALGAG
jgi:signal peptidase